MDSPAGFDEDEDFFGSYDAEQASRSFAAQELDTAEAAAPSAEQLAHAARFRKPVAWFLGAMALLSLGALALRGSEPLIPAPSAHRERELHAHRDRELVAHYGSALPASTTPMAPSEASAPYEPVVWGAVCAAPNACLLDSSVEAAWLSVPSSPSASVEESAFHLAHSNARVRRPVHTSSIGSRVAPSIRVAPSVAAPKPAAAPTGFTSVARFPEERP